MFSISIQGNMRVHLFVFINKFHLDAQSWYTSLDAHVHLDAHLFVFTFKFHLNEHTEIRTLIQIVFSYNDYLYILLVLKATMQVVKKLYCSFSGAEQRWLSESATI